MNNQTKEIFCIAQEECAEVTQAISKIFRFGFDSKHPITGKSNKESLEEETGDMVIDLMPKNNSQSYYNFYKCICNRMVWP
mgnify:CR=1 FL=1